MESQRIAVVGSGIAGLATAWLLGHRHDVTLFERNDYIGGHTHTHAVDTDRGQVAVDSGFIVFNERNYPNLCGLFDTLGVASRASDMSFGVSLDQGRVEYGGSSLSALYAQRGNLWSPAHQRMVVDILRFNRQARRDLESDQLGALTVDEYLARRGLGSEFRNRYLLPMAAAIWSCPVTTMGQFPAASLVRFFRNHGLLNLRDRPVWRTVVGGSRTYVDRMLQDLPGRAHTSCGVTRITRTQAGPSLRLADGSEQVFDQVVVAAHADQALAMLGDATHQERALLSCFRYQWNRAILHTDRGLMPRRRAVWSSWNYLAETTRAQADEARVSVTYWMNRLQGLPATPEFFVTLNPLQDPREDTVIAEMGYEHPVFDHGAMAAQSRLDEIQGQKGTWFCGSYFGYGFHEDGLVSAIRVAKALGVTPAWQQANTPHDTAAPALVPGLQGA